MVTLEQARASNARIATELTQCIVAVFVGATSGIGEATLKQFAKQVPICRVYFVGRSQEAGDRIARECQVLNPRGSFTFLKGDLSLIHTVDELCHEIKSRESEVNILFNSAGQFTGSHKTSEGLPFLYALLVHSRIRFVLNLLPLLQNASSLRRVVSVFTGGKEGAVDKNDLAGQHISVLSARGHMSSLVTLSLEQLAERAPDITFIHNFPGTVQGNAARSGQGAAIYILNKIFNALPASVYITHEECGDRHLFLLTSARYSPKAHKEAVSAVSLSSDVDSVNGTSGMLDSGVYSLDWKGESSGQKVVEVMAKLRAEGVGPALWEETQIDCVRITGVDHI